MTDRITIERETAEQAMAALVAVGGSNARNAYAGLRAALAAQPAEPVAEIVRNEAGQITMRSPDGSPFDMSQFVGVTLYATPPAPAGNTKTKAAGEISRTSRPE